MQEATFWVLENFVFLDPTYRDYQTLIEAAVLYRGHAPKFGVVLDPWNTLEHLRPMHLSETEYISEALTFLSTWARSANLHVWVVVHPAKIYKSKDTGKRDVPTLDIAGSAHWYNKADDVITVHRDQTAGNPLVDIHILKVRFKQSAGLARSSCTRPDQRPLLRPGRRGGSRGSLSRRSR